MYVWCLMKRLPNFMAYLLDCFELKILYKHTQADIIQTPISIT